MQSDEQAPSQDATPIDQLRTLSDVERHLARKVDASVVAGFAAAPPAIGSPRNLSCYRDANALRLAIKSVADRLNGYRRGLSQDDVGPVAQFGEVIANATLAYRHLEDASMRLGKVLQAIDGGVSVYDRETTVGA